MLTLKLIIFFVVLAIQFALVLYAFKNYALPKIKDNLRNLKGQIREKSPLSSAGELTRIESCEKERERIFRAINSYAQDDDDSIIDAQIRLAPQITKHIKEFQDVYTGVRVGAMPEKLPLNVILMKEKI